MITRRTDQTSFATYREAALAAAEIDPADCADEDTLEGALLAVEIAVLTAGGWDVTMCFSERELPEPREPPEPDGECWRGNEATDFERWEQAEIQRRLK